MSLKAYYDMDTNIITSSCKAAEQLAARIKRIEPLMIGEPKILVSSFVNINNLEETSAFGRTIAEYIGSHLTEHGFKLVEMRLRKSVFIQKKGGEFLLSRAIKDISTAHHAHALLVGTYAVAENVVYISARLINPVNAETVSAYAYRLPLGNNNLKMLGIKQGKSDKKFPPGPLGN